MMREYNKKITYYLNMIFCFKQQTANEMRISDMSSDVYSSDLLTVYNRQHRHPGIRIVRLDEKSERPEMRRCPEKDKREERKWERRYVARRGYPADQGRKSASSTADNDVLGRPAFQPNRIDQHVEKD